MWKVMYFLDIVLEEELEETVVVVVDEDGLVIHFLLHLDQSIEFLLSLSVIF